MGSHHINQVSPGETYGRVTNRSSDIVSVRSWEALDSRGRPTVAARVDLVSGHFGTAIVPSGASAGSHEAVELRDGGRRYAGRGVRVAVNHVNTTLRTAVIGVDPTERGTVDAVLRTTDPEPDYRNIGANAVLAVSIAAERAAAAHTGVSLARWLRPDGPLPLPMPMVNVISGGAHAGRMIDVQDFLVVPLAAGSFGQAIEWCAAIRDAAAALMIGRGYPGAALVADEGGLGIPLSSNRDALEVISDGIAAAGLESGTDVGIAIDVAATQFYRKGCYEMVADGRSLTASELISEIEGWRRDFPIVSVEDILAEDDWAGWTQANRRLGRHTQLVGDDLFVTNLDRLERGIREESANSVLVKVNQNGLLTGARSVLDRAANAGFTVVVSARSGETEDNWLADLAVGWGADQIKVGSTHRSERGAKWNRLLEFEAIEETSFRPWPHSATDTSARSQAE